MAGWTIRGPASGSGGGGPTTGSGRDSVTHELRDEPREDDGLILGHEGARPRDESERGTGEIAREPTGIARREDEVAPSPGDEHRAVEVGERRGRLQGVAVGDRGQENRQVAADPRLTQEGL